MTQESDKPDSLQITSKSKPATPVFSCIVYVQRIPEADGVSAHVVGRVANLAGIESRGESERSVLSKITREFKSQVAQKFASGAEISWIDPVPPPQENEQSRSIPIHL